MTQYAYLASLVVVLCCMAVMDHRWRLFLWSDARRALPVLLVSFVFFLVWDTVALSLDYYERGGSAYITGIEVAGLVPIEEPLFCLFLPYLTMVVHGLLSRAFAEESP